MSEVLSVTLVPDETLLRNLRDGESMLEVAKAYPSTQRHGRAGERRAPRGHRPHRGAEKLREASSPRRSRSSKTEGAVQSGLDGVG